MMRALLPATNLLTVLSISAAFANGLLGAGAPQRGAAPSLKIVVITGEDAVNVIQSRTAVAPIVEVRDSNNQPMAAVPVTFAIQGGGATFGGASTLATITDAQGRASATGLTATSSGPIAIVATATFQGQAVTTTIVQRNVLTAPSPATGAGTGATGTTAAAAQSTGRRKSRRAVLIIGAAAGGAGVVAATAGGSSTSTAIDNAPAHSSSTGTYQFPVVETIRNPQTNTGFCTYNLNVAGTLTLELDVTSAGAVSGLLTNVWQELEVSRTGACGPSSPSVHTLTGEVTGSSSASSNIQSSRTDTHPSGAGTSTRAQAFTGVFNGTGATISGTLTMSLTYTEGPAFTDSYPNTTTQVNLQKRP